MRSPDGGGWPHEFATHLCLLLVAALSAPAAASYYSSAAACGLDGSLFVTSNFQQALAASSLGAGDAWRSVGVCDWGISTYAVPRSDGAPACLACMFTPTSSPSCPAGYRIDRSQRWNLAAKDTCQQSSGCLNVACPTGFVQGDESAGGTWCGPGRQARTCCPVSSYYMCCQAVMCTKSDSLGASSCVVQDKVLKPGQAMNSTVYAVPAASTPSCPSYAYTALRTCGTDNNLEGGRFSSTCNSMSALTDAATGCPALPGYVFLANQLYANPQEAIYDDGIPWSQLAAPDSARQAAGQDALLMAARCDRSTRCTAFDLTGSAELRSYIPLPDSWVSTSAANTTRGACVGTYVKQSQLPACSRVPGYLFAAGVTWRNSSQGLCSNCSDATALADQCSGTSNCTGFSSKHGMLIGAQVPGAQQLFQFTTTPCMGMFTRVSAALPAEAEAVDKLLCGDSFYCSHPLQYSAVTARAGGLSTTTLIDLTLTISHVLPVPLRLTSPNAATLATLPSLPQLRALRLVCTGTGRLVGGLPRQLLRAAPNLEEFVVTGCGVQDKLPLDLAVLAPDSLQSLDLSGNMLWGPLPDPWSAGFQSLVSLNLSSNQLTGALPNSWQAIIDSGAGVQGTQLDLSFNSLGGPLPREFVTAACIWREIRVIFSLGVTVDDGSHMPAVMLQGNSLMQQWAGSYLYALGKTSYSSSEHSDNMCGSYTYIVTIALLWGCFVLSLGAITAWWFWRRAAQRRPQLLHRHTQEAAAAAAAGGLSRHSSGSAVHEGGSAGKSAVVQLDLGSPSSWGHTFDRWWSQVWVRRVIFLARLSLLVADIALDIRIVAWLMADGSIKEADVCAAFIALAQLVVALGVFANIFIHVFGSLCSLMFLGFPLLAITPALAPVMAIWNVINPDVPLVFWRYLELVEFSVMLFQSPAQAVTQTIIYARHAHLGAGMYIDHPLFIASITLSLTDMAISVFKLARYKKGPWARVCNAFSHLSLSRDPAAYQAMEEEDGWYSDLRPSPSKKWVPPPTRGESYIDAAAAQGDQGGFVSMHNPLLGSKQGGSSSQGGGKSPSFSALRVVPGGGSHQATAQHPISPTSSTEPDDGTYSPEAHYHSFQHEEKAGREVTGTPTAAQRSSGSLTAHATFVGKLTTSGRYSQDRSQQQRQELAVLGSGLEGADHDQPSLARLSRTSAGSAHSSMYSSAASTSHWAAAARLPPPPTHPASLTQSSLRLVMSSAMESISSAAIPVAPVVGRGRDVVPGVAGPGPRSSGSGSSSLRVTVTAGAGSPRERPASAPLGKPPRPPTTPVGPPSAALASAVAAAAVTRPPSAGSARSPLGRGQSVGSNTLPPPPPAPQAAAAGASSSSGNLVGGVNPAYEGLSRHTSGGVELPGPPYHSFLMASGGSGSEVVASLLRKQSSGQIEGERSGAHYTPASGSLTPEAGASFTQGAHSQSVTRAWASNNPSFTSSSHAGPRGLLQVEVVTSPGPSSPQTPFTSTAAALTAAAAQGHNVKLPASPGLEASPQSQQQPTSAPSPHQRLLGGHSGRRYSGEVSQQAAGSGPAVSTAIPTTHVQLPYSPSGGAGSHLPPPQALGMSRSAEFALPQGSTQQQHHILHPMQRSSLGRGQGPASSPAPSPSLAPSMRPPSATTSSQQGSAGPHGEGAASAGGAGTQQPAGSLGIASLRGSATEGGASSSTGSRGQFVPIPAARARKLVFGSSSSASAGGAGDAGSSGGGDGSPAHEGGRSARATQ